MFEAKVSVHLDNLQSVSRKVYTILVLLYLNFSSAFDGRCLNPTQCYHLPSPTS